MLSVPSLLQEVKVVSVAGHKWKQCEQGISSTVQVSCSDNYIKSTIKLKQQFALFKAKKVWLAGAS